MLQKFIDGEIRIKVTIDDLSYLKVLEEMTGLKFRSGDSLCGDYMIRLLTIYKRLYLTVSHDGVIFRASIPDDEGVPIARLFEPQIAVEENEILSLLGD